MREKLQAARVRETVNVPFRTDCCFREFVLLALYASNCGAESHSICLSGPKCTILRIGTSENYSGKWPSLFEAIVLALIPTEGQHVAVLLTLLYSWGS